jgi:HemY protein
LAWNRPPDSELMLPGGSEMLPLIVGPSATENRAVTVVEDTDIQEAEDMGNPTSKTA